MAKFFALKIIRLYQKTLSFDHGFFKFMFPHGFCKFQPTCSDYAYSAVEKYGVARGGLKAAWRVMRCNPFSKGGLDLVE
ncbi:membrane protein insertion efficiency factor YidD [Patescibacteria group bacterium]|nr:membrane protein insertion efficiency factor YidD [Patescibacteria group bacterium]MBU1922111.1 membrane protein insertion efficiency factor YidD [Patescibacteria group bacterium]